MSKRGGLGRGLSALIPGAPEAGEASGLLEVPVNAVSPNPKQPRTHFDDEAIASLAVSIREVGILQPIVVRKAGAGYELIAGERRLRAAKLAGLATIPAVVRDSEDADTLREALIENIHREDLGPIELAEAFRRCSTTSGSSRRSWRIGWVCRGHTSRTRSGCSSSRSTCSSCSRTGRCRPVTPGRCWRSATPRRRTRSRCARPRRAFTVREVEELVRGTSTARRRRA